MTTIREYRNLQALSEIWAITATKFADIIALYDPHSKPEVKLTFSQLYEQLKIFAAGLQSLGIVENDKICLIADNSPRWFIADQGSMLAGASNAVRSSQSDPNELLHILQDSDSSILIVEDIKTLEKLYSFSDQFNLRLIILLSNEKSNLEIPVKVLNFTELMKLGKNFDLRSIVKKDTDLATLIYTSGTTGKPKGAMLSHGNILHQIRSLDTIIKPKPGDRILSILPSWHSYERSAEYFLLSQGCTLIYTNIRNFKNDLKKFKPHHMVGVPRLWESLYEVIKKQFREQSVAKEKIIKYCFENSLKFIVCRRIFNCLSLENLKPSFQTRAMAFIRLIALYPIHKLADLLVYRQIRDNLGGSFKTLISGGGSLAKHLDDFYEIIDIPILVGYGLTETSPVANARTHKHNLRGTAGQPIAGTEINIVDPNTRQILSKGKCGLILIRGPQVMQGYYKKIEETNKVKDSQGWFDSGDLGWLTPMNDLVITGRIKDTIVLSNGENIEPQPIEDACLRSVYIDQIMLVGQDQKMLGALIVPNLDMLKSWAEDQNLHLNIPSKDELKNVLADNDLYSQSIQDLYRKELKKEVQNRPGYRSDDLIKTFDFILEPFSIENNMMTQTLKMKRLVIMKHYQVIIDKMFNS